MTKKVHQNEQIIKEGKYVTVGYSSYATNDGYSLQMRQSSRENLSAVDASAKQLNTQNSYDSNLAKPGFFA